MEQDSPRIFIDLIRLMGISRSALLISKDFLFGWKNLKNRGNNPFFHLQFAGQDDKVINKNEEAVMFRKYSWLIYVFIVAFLLPGNFICLWGLKIRKPVVTYVIPDKKDPLNQFTATNDRHIVHFSDSGNLLTLGYVGKTEPKVDFTVFLAKGFSPVWQITWNGEDYFDYNGDMIFDLKMPLNARKNGFLFSDGGV